MKRQADKPDGQPGKKVCQGGKPGRRLGEGAGDDIRRRVLMSQHSQLSEVPRQGHLPNAPIQNDTGVSLDGGRPSVRDLLFQGIQAAQSQQQTRDEGASQPQAQKLAQQAKRRATLNDNELDQASGDGDDCDGEDLYEQYQRLLPGVYVSSSPFARAHALWP